MQLSIEKAWQPGMELPSPCPLSIRVSIYWLVSSHWNKRGLIPPMTYKVAIQLLRAVQDRTNPHSPLGQDIQHLLRDIIHH